ncbi:hypothetical protein [Halomontanus rarus]|uniref:hypothetical protein n=1 Tax=Halomontanus rarus TaxID=3034020 RepID=UPI00293BC0CD|nr:hypothetical protein [Halovivax sp. KZCA124]
MSSDDGNPEELSFDEEETELETEEESKTDNIVPLRREYENANKEIERQLDTLAGISDRSMKLSQATFVLLGLLATGVSISGSDSFQQRIIEAPHCAFAGNAGCFSTYYLTMIILFLIVISLYLFLNYTAPHIDGDRQSTPEDLQYVLKDKPTEKEYIEHQLKEYQTRIQNNRKMISSHSLGISIGIISIVFALMGIAALIYSVTTQGPVPRSMVILLALLALSFLAYLKKTLPDEKLAETPVIGDHLVKEK